MKLFFEGYPYPLDLLRSTFDNDVQLSNAEGENMKQISCVGYYFNKRINDMVFILPKVFVSENKKAFDRYDPVAIMDISPSDNVLKANTDDKVIFELSIWLYQAISHYLERNQRSNISSNVNVQSVRHKGEKGSKTIVEMILSFRAFQKKHRNLFTYISLVKSCGNNKVHWNKTISQMQPLFKNGTPIYLEFRNKKKVINFDEELIILFYSVLNYLSDSYPCKFESVGGYELLKPSKIKSLIESQKGTRLLKSIRRKYFTDELVELWGLLYEFFEREELIGSGKPFQEKLLVSNFNLIFEDMIDQLISDNLSGGLQKLKKQPDRKQVDHIYQDQSIIDEDRQIYYIGDSKYYKETTDLGEYSIYKQYTYAKNVIQYNINVFNETQDDTVFRYRDSLTEGYNVTPNFFIRGTIDFNNPRSTDPNVKIDKSLVKPNQHFANRLFDRDTLFLQTYDINFMYVVASYVNNSNNESIKKAIKTMFRKDFLAFIEKRFEFSVLVPKHDNLTELVEKYFKKLLGKIYQPAEVDNLLILALDGDKSYQIENLQLIAQLQEDFNIYDYQLGTNPEEATRVVPYRYLETMPSMAAEGKETFEKYRQDSEKIAHYTKHNPDSVLFGIYKDAEHLQWITSNNKYNVRLGDRAGAVKRTRQVTSAKYLVLYELSNEKNYTVYNLGEKHHIWDTEKMLEAGYPVKDSGENNLYYLYEIIGPTDELGEIDIEAVLSQKRKQFEEDTKSPMEPGTPIYVYENELLSKEPTSGKQFMFFFFDEDSH